MAFDPAKPANNAPISSVELRAQLNALKAFIDDRPPRGELVQTLAGNSAGPCDEVTALAPTATLQNVISKINEMLAALKRE